MTPDPEQPEYAPTYRLGEWIARARKEMGEEVWQRLNREWNAPDKAKEG